MIYKAYALIYLRKCDIINSPINKNLTGGVYAMTFELFQKLMSFDTKGRSCIEILFSVKESEKFDYSWMG